MRCVRRRLVGPPEFSTLKKYYLVTRNIQRWTTCEFCGETSGVTLLSVSVSRCDDFFHPFDTFAPLSPCATLLYLVFHLAAAARRRF
jgi:hypothetical protein